MTDGIEQQVRKMHCSWRGAQPHNCAGTCTITPSGIKLDCPLCGEDAIPLVSPRRSHTTERAVRILSRAGLDFHVLTPEVQREVLDECERDSCPGCGALVSLGTRVNATCGCGNWHRTSTGWHRVSAPDDFTSQSAF